MPDTLKEAVEKLTPEQRANLRRYYNGVADHVGALKDIVLTLDIDEQEKTAMRLVHAYWLQVNLGREL